MKTQIDINSLWVFAGAFILILITLVFAVETFSSTPNTETLDEFAQCLADNGLTMYGTSWCSHCKNQKELFGKSFQYVDYVDCDKDRGICTVEGVKGYPTWKINSQSYPGEQSFDRLSQLTGCVLNQTQNG